MSFCTLDNNLIWFNKLVDLVCTHVTGCLAIDLCVNSWCANQKLCD